MFISPKRQSAFTIIELLVVIVVIGILATISSIGFSRFQAEGRDSQRTANAIVIAEALEKYYDENGEYPSCTALSQTPAVISNDVFPGIDSGALQTPSGDAPNAINCQDLIASGGDDVFVYVGDGSSDCLGAGSCLQFTLKYKDERNGSIATIESRRKTPIATSGTITLSGSVTGFTTASFTWTSISNAVNYTIERSTNNSFSANVVAAPSSTPSVTLTDLTAGTGYYFRVKANASTGVSDVSNTIQGITPELATPTASANVNTFSQITVSWAAVVDAQTYRLEYSTVSNFSANVTAITGITALNRAVTGLTVGTTYYFRVQALATGDTSEWSSTVNATPFVSAPTNPSISAAMSGTNARGTSGGATCSPDTSLEYSIRYRNTSTTTEGGWSSWSAWSPTVFWEIGALQGHRYGFQAQARCTVSGGVSAATANATVATVVRSISQPSAPTWANATSWKNRAYYVVNYSTSCPSGTSVTGGNYTSRSWAGSYYYHDFGFNDWWVLGPSGGATVEYWGRYQCVSSYATSSVSPDRYTGVLVFP
jgi:prepilin-type N-terminal cleavage/methylation domain-containing protein